MSFPKPLPYLVNGDGLVDVEDGCRQVADEEGHNHQHEGQSESSLVSKNNIDLKKSFKNKLKLIRKLVGREKLS